MSGLSSTLCKHTHFGTLLCKMHTHTCTTQNNCRNEKHETGPTVFIQTEDAASYIQAITSAPEKKTPIWPNNGQQRPLEAGQSNVLSSQ